MWIERFFCLFMAFLTLYPEKLALLFLILWSQWSSCSGRHCINVMQRTCAHTQELQCANAMGRSPLLFSEQILFHWSGIHWNKLFVLVWKKNLVYRRKCCFQHKDAVVSSAASQQEDPEFESPAILLCSFCVDTLSSGLPRCLRKNYQLWS